MSEKKAVKTVMNAKLREKMRGFLPMEKDAVYEFTFEEFKDIEEDEFKPIFSIRQFTKEETILIKRLVAESYRLVEESKTNNKKKKEAALKQIKENDLKQCKLSLDVVLGWRNLYFLSTSEELKECVYSEENKKRFTDNMIGEILAEALKITGFLS